MPVAGVQTRRCWSPSAAAAVDSSLLGRTGTFTQPIGRLHQHAVGQRRHLTGMSVTRQEREEIGQRRHRSWKNWPRTNRRRGKDQQPGTSSGEDTHLGVPSLRRSLAAVLLRQPHLRTVPVVRGAGRRVRGVHVARLPFVRRQSVYLHLSKF